MKSGTAPAITEVLNITEDSMPLEEPAVKAYQGVANIIAEEEVEENGTPFFPNKPVELRENFAETAFFYPALVTDEAGRKQHDLETATAGPDGRPEIRLPVPRNHHQQTVDGNP